MSQKAAPADLRGSFFVRLASWGLAMVPLSIVVAIVAGNATGAFAAVPPLGLLALVMAIVLRTGRGLIPGMVVAVLCVLIYVVADVVSGALQLGHTESFADFVPALLRATGSLTALLGITAAIGQRRRRSIPPTRPLQRRLAMTGAGALVLVAGLSAVLTYNDRSEAEMPPGSIVVVTTDDSFEPSALRARPGETLRVFVRNVDRYAHTFTIDALALDVYIGPRSERLVAFSVPDRPRHYKLFCAVTGHESMEGKLIVAA